MDQGQIFILTFVLFALAMVLALVVARHLTGSARDLALRHQVLSPVTERSSHAEPTPRLGGLGLAAGFFSGALLFLGGLWLIPHEGAMIGFHPGLVFWLAVGWLGMLATGLLDDLRDLSPAVKLGLMTLSAAVAAIGGGLTPDLAPSPVLPLFVRHGIGLLAVVLWILFFTNAFNFMDGMDGLAGSFARSAAIFIFALMLASGYRHDTINLLRGEAYMLPILAMACWGFLHWNAPPARVFMGDGGSLSVGYLLAVAPLIGAEGRFGIRLPLFPVLIILSPFLFDVLLTMIRRMRRGENLLIAHRQHLYQRLLQTGLSHAAVLAINRRLFIGCGLAGVAGAQFYGWTGQLAALMLATLMLCGYWRMTLRREQQARSARST